MRQISNAKAPMVTSSLPHTLVSSDQVILAGP